MKLLFSRKKSNPSDDFTGGFQPAVDRGSINGSGTAAFRVTVPDNIRPGEEFQVYAASRIVRVRCPLDSGPGQLLQINVPLDDSGPLGSAGSNPEFDLPPNSPNVSPIPNSCPPAYMVTVPPGVRMGQRFAVTIQGQELEVTCPIGAREGTPVRVVPEQRLSPPILPRPKFIPPPSFTSSPTYDSSPSYTSRPSIPSLPPRNKEIQLPPFTDFYKEDPKKKQGASRTKPKPVKNQKTNQFEVEVPKGVTPGAPFALMAGGVRVLVMCPPNATPGKKIRFELPSALLERHKIANEWTKIKLTYDKEGWTRTVRATDLKFQWIRMDDHGDIDLNKRFQFQKSAYVRKLEFRPGKDPKLLEGILSLVPANEAVAESKIKAADGRELVTYSDLAQAQVKKFEEKVKWFQDTCDQLCIEWNEGHMRINVRRKFLLGDSVDAIMSLSRKDLRKIWRFEFIGEPGLDAGGVAREWFELVCKEIFDPDMGLWMSSTTNQMSMTINPASEFCCEDHLIYYRFLGRVMGKAMFDRQLVKGHMAKHLYKHMLGWPIQFKDLESVDEDYYRNLKKLQAMAENGEDVGLMCLDFTTTSDILGSKAEVELIKGGKDIEVTNDNFPEYVEACLKYKLMDCVKPQLKELLLGFFDVIPEPLLTVFDFQELELLMCGLPEIDMDDWKRHTEYSGEYEQYGHYHPTCQWFWEVVSEFDGEMRARLLQFVTGTSGVPSRGFGVLQGNDGNIRKFTIHGVPLKSFYPRAHTCFNRIDLPMYTSKEALCEKLKFVVTMSSTGFDIE